MEPCLAGTHRNYRFFARIIVQRHVDDNMDGVFHTQNWQCLWFTARFPTTGHRRLISRLISLECNGRIVLLILLNGHANECQQSALSMTNRRRNHGKIVCRARNFATDAINSFRATPLVCPIRDSVITMNLGYRTCVRLRKGIQSAANAYAEGVLNLTNFAMILRSFLSFLSFFPVTFYAENLPELTRNK